jgi:hypothetical protein
MGLDVSVGLSFPSKRFLHLEQPLGRQPHTILKPTQDAWLKKCQEKHGHLMPGVYAVRRGEVEGHKGAWQKVTHKLERSG